MQELTLEQPLRVNKALHHKATYMIQEPKTNQGFKHKEFTMKTSASTQNIFIAKLGKYWTNIPTPESNTQSHPLQPDKKLIVQQLWLVDT